MTIVVQFTEQDAIFPYIKKASLTTVVTPHIRTVLPDLSMSKVITLRGELNLLCSVLAKLQVPPSLMHELTNAVEVQRLQILTMLGSQTVRSESHANLF